MINGIIYVYYVSPRNELTPLILNSKYYLYVLLANFLYQILYTYDYVGTLSKMSEVSHVRFQSLL